MRSGRDLLRAVRAQGGRVRRTRDGHLKVYRGDELVTVLRSQDEEAGKHLYGIRATLRRAGFDV